MKKLLLLTALLIGFFSQAQDYSSYLAAANKAFESGMYRQAYDNATKAIELNATNEARWLRVQSSLTANAPKERLETAIVDLNLIAQKEPTAKTYKTLGLAEEQLATFILHFNKTVPGYLNESEAHYRKASEAYKKAVGLSPELEPKLKYDIKNIANKLEEIKATKA
ncbi:hypothetical protein [Flavobacterium sp. UMI-01]|uniref:hypothetical protein n=1 Tax=Flavobacterium sp. UMI-01 TaxID=1441053 RepID=UPI001C7CD626|nr:hypothetical protein [Flavobacterium sp. UMI-01]GIZ10000.1 hypothetical protein FUMI01_27260 [Flavobacterium sp. UMI-01]